MKRVVAFVTTALLAACVTVNEDDRHVVTVPDRASFPAVSDLLDHRCGTLDCHGSTARNLRIYGHEGLRLDASSRPSSKPDTTVAEYDATFASVVGLEPEILAQVVREGGANPERLTFVRKARGTEAHKGLSIWAEGDPEDVCVTSWLAGKTDTATCQAALAAH